MRLTSAALLALAACNGSGSGKTCAGHFLPGDLVLTEIFANPAGSDTGNEWIEFYNATDAPANLEGLVLVNSATDGTGEKTHHMTAAQVAAGAYFVAGDTTQDLVLPWVDYGYANDLGGLRQAGGRVALRCGDTIIDEATYTAVTEATSRGLSGAQPPDALTNDDPNNWCDATMEFTPGSKGSPGEPNESCGPIGQPDTCSDNGTVRDLVKPQVGDLVITEWMANPHAANDATGEWFEVAVLRDVDLNGLQLGTTPPTVRTTLTDAACLRRTAGSYVLFARSKDASMNGMLPPVDFTFDFGLTNSSSGDPLSLFIGAGDQVLDQVTYTSSGDGASTALDPSKTNPTDNDDPNNFCPGTTVFGDGDKGTPGKANLACPAVTPQGKCNDGAMQRDVVAPVPGDLVITEVLADSASPADDTLGEWFEVYVNANVDLNGLQIGPDAATVRDTLASADCLRATAGSYLVFAHSNDPMANGGLPRVDYVANFTLTNSADKTIALSLGGMLLDSATYPAPQAGTAASLPPAHRNTTDNDVSANFCPATASYGAGNLGTPGQANPPCP